jgi:hypothetical protein
LHLQRSAGQAAERLLGFSDEGLAESVKVWLNPGRDRWLNTEGLKALEFWLHTLREFWLMAAEEAHASGTDMEAFEKMAEDCGYLPGHSTPIGRRVWAVMVTQRKSLNQTMEDQGLSIGQELNQYEEPADWIHDGTITHAFPAFAYFSGVLAASRFRELEKLPTMVHETLAVDPVGARPAAVVDTNSAVDTADQPAEHLSYQKAPAFVYQYPDDFPASGQLAIENARRKVNQQLERKGVCSYKEHRAARVEWFWQVVSVAATTIRESGITRQWGANRRREILYDFSLQAAEAARIAGRDGSRFENLIESER